MDEQINKKESTLMGCVLLWFNALLVVLAGLSLYLIALKIYSVLFEWMF